MRTQTPRQSEPKRVSTAASRQAAREVLLLCITASLAPPAAARLSRVLSEKIDWHYLLELAEFNGVTPLVARNLTGNGLSGHVPATYLSRLEQLYKGSVYRNIVFADEMAKVLVLFAQHGIATIALKGTPLSEILYGNPCLRTIVDIDILVRPENLPQAGSLLIASGYKQIATAQRDHPFHGDPYYKPIAKFPVFIELHWDMEDRRLVTVPTEEIWNRARPFQLQGAATQVLSLEDTLLFSADQLAKQSTHLLKVLGDITELLKQHGGSLDWNYILTSARAWQIEVPLYFALVRARELLGASVPEDVINKLRPSAWRCRMLELLAGRDAFLAPIRDEKLRSETFALVRSLTMRSLPQALTVLNKYRGEEKTAGWLSTAIWALVAFGTNLGRRVSGAVIKPRKQVA